MIISHMAALAKLEERFTVGSMGFRSGDNASF